MQDSGDDDRVRRMHVFDRRAVRQHRERAAAGLDRHDFLLHEVGERLADRLDDVRRTFPLALDLGCHSGQLARLLAGRGGVETLVQTDLAPRWCAGPKGCESPPMRRRCLRRRQLRSGHEPDEPALGQRPAGHAGADPPLPSQPDGLFLGAMLGGTTLTELRQALHAAEIQGEGGLSPRVSPFADARDAGNLLQRAGFALAVADAETVTVSYANPLALIEDLRGIGKTNAVRGRRLGCRTGGRRCWRHSITIDARSPAPPMAASRRRFRSSSSSAGRRIRISSGRSSRALPARGWRTPLNPPLHRRRQTPTVAYLKSPIKAQARPPEPMQFSQPLLRGTLVKRYKRFFAEVALADGSVVTAHCPNPGSMLSVNAPGSVVWLSEASNPARTLKYTWELIEVGDTLVGVNTGLPNRLAVEAVQDGAIPALAGYDDCGARSATGRAAALISCWKMANDPHALLKSRMSP